MINANDAKNTEKIIDKTEIAKPWIDRDSFNSIVGGIRVDIDTKQARALAVSQDHIKLMMRFFIVRALLTL